MLRGGKRRNEGRRAVVAKGSSEGSAVVPGVERERCEDNLAGVELGDAKIARTISWSDVIMTTMRSWMLYETSCVGGTRAANYPL